MERLRQIQEEMKAREEWKAAEVTAAFAVRNPNPPPTWKGEEETAKALTDSAAQQHEKLRAEESMECV